MPQTGMEEKYQASNPNLVPTANNLVNARPSQPQWNQGGVNIADALAGVRPQPQIPQGGGGAMPGNFTPGSMPGNFTALQGMAAGNAQMVNPQIPIVQQIDPATGQPVQVPTAQSHSRADTMPTAADVMNTVQPVGPPQPAPAIPQEIQGMMNNIMTYFNSNPEAASAVFGQGGLQNFQAKLGSLFQPINQSPNYVNSLAGQVAGRSGSVIQGLKNLFANRQA